jgi:hypothetical protein
MSDTRQELREELKKSQELLKTLVGEIRVKMHLAGMEARDRWKELSADAEHIGREVDQASRTAVEEMIGRLKQFKESLKPKA